MYSSLNYIQGGITIITLILNSNKSLSAVNHSKIYYGENRIGEIKIIAPETIGNKRLNDCDVTLYVAFGDFYINYSLSFDENNTCVVPITDNITEDVGIHEMYIEIKSGSSVLGRTNSVNLRVYPYTNRDTEIIKREVYIAQIEELTERIASDDSDFNDIKETLIYLEADVDDNTPTSSYASIMRNISGIPKGIVAGIIDNSISGELDIPYGTTNIPMYKFHNCRNITSVHLPDTLSSIDSYAFSDCQNMKAINIPRSVSRLMSYTFGYCYQLESINIPNTITYMESAVFAACHNLKNVTIEDGFNANNLSLQSSSKYTADTIAGWLNALADRTGLFAYTLTIGSANLQKLTPEQIAIATNKNWNLV